jgi:hypothetical protein
MDTRSDDRMMLRVNFKDVKNNNKQDGGGSPNSQQPSDVVFFQAEDPCEEDPDTDVLAEETVAVESDGDQRGQLHNGYEEEAMKTGRSFDSRFCQLGLPNRRVQRKVLIHEWRLLAARVPDTIRAIGLSHHRVTSDVV